MIGIIHYGIGNIGSVRNACRFLDIPSIVSGDISELSTCERLILPGVGAFQPAMDILIKRGLDTFIQHWAEDRKPILGICLGMQLLLSQSEENGLAKGLDLIPGNVAPIPKSKRKIHIGWNQVKPVNSSSIISTFGYAYFVHSYACWPEINTHIIATTDYGEPFVSAIQNENVIGVQFHPEKSQNFGLEILRRFSIEQF